MKNLRNKTSVPLPNCQLVPQPKNALTNSISKSRMRLKHSTSKYICQLSLQASLRKIRRQIWTRKLLNWVKSEQRKSRLKFSWQLIRTKTMLKYKSQNHKIKSSLACAVDQQRTQSWKIRLHAPWKLMIWEHWRSRWGLRRVRSKINLLVPVKWFFSPLNSKNESIC